MFEHWKDHFHPHEGNDHNPHAYRVAGALALALVVVSIVAFTSLQSRYITQSERFLSAVLPSVLVDLANEDRAEAGLDKLTPNETLKQAAQMKANHMAELGYFAHDAPDGTTPWEWFAEAGYEYVTAGENLAINFSDSKDVEEAWMDSPLHRENILEEDFTEIGIATAKGEYEGEETVFVVQMFGRPSAEELAQRSTSDRSNVALAAETEEAPEGEEDTAEVEPENDVEVQSATETDSEAGSDESDNETRNEGAELDNTDALSEGTVVNHMEPEPEPGESDDAADANDGTAANSESDRSTTTPFTDFDPPRTLAQVQGESGIALTPTLSGIEREASQMSHLLSQPEFIFKTLMWTLFSLIALSLLISVGVEAKRHHVAQAAKALGALAVLIVIFFAGTHFLFPDPEITAYSDNRLSAVIFEAGSTPSL